MARNKWNYFVGVYEGNDLKYVTEIDNKNRTAMWKAGENAKSFSMAMASDLCEGLNMNFIHSVVIKAPSYMEIKND